MDYYGVNKEEGYMDKLVVTIRGNNYEYCKGTLIKDIAGKVAGEYKYDIIAASVNGKVTELNKSIEENSDILFFTTDTVVGSSIYRRGLSMLMLKALYSVLGHDNIEKVNIEATIGNGYYCELTGKAELSKELLKKISDKMMEYVNDDITFNKLTMPTDSAMKMFAELGMHDKEKLFRFRRASRVNVYELRGFYDYYYGAMPSSTGILRYFDLELYGDGFVLLVPGRKEPEIIKPFVGSPKFYSVIKESNEWAKSLEVENVGALNEAIADGRINDVIMVQEALHEKRIGDIAASIERNKDAKFVMIAGPSSSGKTTFSYRLSVQLSTLGLKPYPIALDDYFKNRCDTPLNEDGSYNFECLEAIDVEQFNKDMTALIRGEEIELPTFNFITGEREYKGKRKKMGKDEILVIEGIHGLNDKLSYSLPIESKFKIYISALTQLNVDEHNRIPTTDGRLIRRIVRDARTRGADAGKTIGMWQSVRNGEDQYIFPFQEHADAMFNSALIYELAILKQYAEPLLFKVERGTQEYVEAKRLLKFLDYFLGVSSENIPYNSILREFVGKSVFPV